MSFALPSVKPKYEVAPSMGFTGGNFGVPDLMMSGITAGANKSHTHPLIQSERNHSKNRHDLNMTLLRNTQGLHAPMRIAMELKATKRMGRLPFLPSSNATLDSLTGRDIEVGPEDIFGLPEFQEAAGQPHAFLEKSLGLL